MTMATKLPQNIQAEQVVLGLMIINKTCLSDGISRLTGSSFHKKPHSLLFAGIKALFEKGKEIGVVSLTEQLESMNSLDAVGGSIAISGLIESSVSDTEFSVYLEILEDKAAKRRVILAANRIMQEGYEDKLDKNSFLKLSMDLISQTTSGISRDIQVISSGEVYQARRESLIARMDQNVVRFGWTNLDERVVSGLAPGDVSVIAGRPGIGKCLKFDTLIRNADTGELYSIEEVVKRRLDFKVFGIDKENRTVKRKIVGYHANGIQEVFEITFEDGRTIRAAKDHKFKTFEGFSSLSNLSRGDSILYKFFDSGSKKDLYISPYLLGILLADGNLKSVSLTTEYKELVEHIKKIKPGDSSITEKPDKRNPKLYRLRIIKKEKKWNNWIPNPVKQELKRLNLYQVLSGHKFIPKEYQSLDKVSTSFLLAGLFDGDSSIGKGGRPITYGSISKTLVEDIQYLLSRMGIFSILKLHKGKFKGKDYYSYRLFIGQEDSIKRFISTIGTHMKHPPRTRRMFKEKRKKVKTNWNMGNCPKEVWDYVEEKYGKDKLRQFMKEQLKRGKGNLRRMKSQGIGPERLKKLANFLEDEFLRNIPKNDIRFIKIESIESIGKFKVYDLTIERVHNYEINGIITHNSALKSNIKLNLLRAGFGVVGFELEQGFATEQDRLESLMTNIPLEEVIKSGGWKKGDYRIELIKEANTTIDREFNYHIIPSRSMTLADTRAVLYQIKQRTPFHVVFFDLFDNLVDVSVSANKAQTVGVKINEVARMAEEFNCHICCLVQISRRVEHRGGDRRPRLSDLKDSGNYEERARLVLLLYREKYYFEDSLNQEMEIIIAKQSNGPPGKVIMHFEEDTLKITPAEEYLGGFDA